MDFTYGIPVHIQADGALDLSHYIFCEVQDVRYNDVGIDVSKYKFDACVMNDQGQFLMNTRTYFQSRDDMDRLIKDIETTRKDEDTILRIGLESTGTYHRNLMGYLLKHGYEVREYNPIEVCALRKARIRKTKTDKIDAEVIAKAVRLDFIENTERYLTDQDHLRMRELGLLYNNLTEKSALLKTELKESLTVLCPGYDAILTDVLGKSSKEILRSTVKHTKLFDISQEEIESIMLKNFMSPVSAKNKSVLMMKCFESTTLPEYYKEALIVDVRFILDQHDLLLKQINMLEARLKRAIRDIDPVSMSIPGIGPVTCAIILGTLGNVKRFANSRAVVAYAGLDPKVVQSGRSINRTGRISKRGNRYLRKALHNAALVGIRYNPVLKQKYAHLMKRGKGHMVALTACARHLLVIVYSVEKNQKRFYVPKYVSDE
jgi:transposase